MTRSFFLPSGIIVSERRLEFEKAQSTGLEDDGEQKLTYPLLCLSLPGTRVSHYFSILNAL